MMENPTPILGNPQLASNCGMSVAVEADLLASSGWSADFVSCVRSMRSYAFACHFSSGALNL